MSSISQMERSSSQTRMLPTRSSSHRKRCGVKRRLRLLRASLRSGESLFRREATQTQHKDASLPQLGTGPNLAFVGLDNLVHDGQAQAGPTFELRLERLEH